MRETETEKNPGIAEVPESKSLSGPSYALHHHRPLTIQLIGIAGMRLLLAVLQTRTGMGLEHAVL